MTKKESMALVPIDQISAAIHQLRGHRVILDRDLATIYGVKTGRLNEAVSAMRTASRQILCFG